MPHYMAIMQLVVKIGQPRRADIVLPVLQDTTEHVENALCSTPWPLLLWARNGR